MPTNDVRLIGRATQGVTIIDLDENDKVVSIARLDEDKAAAAEVSDSSNPSATPSLPPS